MQNILQLVLEDCCCCSCCWRAVLFSLLPDFDFFGRLAPAAVRLRAGSMRFSPLPPTLQPPRETSSSMPSTFPSESRLTSSSSSSSASCWPSSSSSSSGPSRSSASVAPSCMPGRTPPPLPPSRRATFLELATLIPPDAAVRFPLFSSSSSSSS